MAGSAGAAYQLALYKSQYSRSIGESIVNGYCESVAHQHALSSRPEGTAEIASHAEPAACSQVDPSRSGQTFRISLSELGEFGG
jgi:hypothetical protein